MSSNQGRDIEQLLDDVTLADLQEASKAVHLEIERHRYADATCDCPLIEGLAVLYERGYRFTRLRTD